MEDVSTKDVQIKLVIRWKEVNVYMVLVTVFK